MDDQRFYVKLYQALEDATPLRFDCGRLCDRACCRADAELPGMYLFPGEEAMFEGKPGYSVVETALPGYGQVPLLSCEGACTREERPLACRVFPLAPSLADGQLAVRLDPRGRRVCPLCRGDDAALSGDFTRAVLGVFTALAREPRAAAFLRALAACLDEFGRPL